TAVEAIGELVLRIKRNLRGMGMLSSAHFGVEHASEEIESRRDRVVAAAHDAAKACAYHSPTQVPPTAFLFFPFGQIVSAQAASVSVAVARPVAPFRFVWWNLAPVRLAPVKLTSSKCPPLRSAPVKSAFVRLAPMKFAPASLAPTRETPTR